MTIEYNTKTMAAVFDRWKFVRTHVARFFHQTNNITINKYIAGGDIYVSKLLAFCNDRNVDLLQYFMHDGKPYYTNMCELAALEDAGIRVDDILRDRSIVVEPVRNIFHNETTEPTKTVPIEASQQEETAKLESSQLEEGSFNNLLRQLHTHEREALDRQRQDLMTLVNYKDRIIAAKEEEICRLRDMVRDALQGKIVSPDIFHSASMVAGEIREKYTTSDEF